MLMNDHASKLHRRHATPGEGVRSTAGFGLPRNLLEKGRDRVKVMALLVLGGAGFSAVVRLALATASEGISRTELIGIAYAGIVAVVAALFYGAARAKRIEPVHILRVGLLFEVGLCFTISMGNVWQIYAAYGHLPFLTWATPIVIAFPLIIPSPPRVTLLTALAAGTSAPLSVLLLSRIGAVTAVSSDYMWVSISPVIAVAVAYVGSRVVYGFNVDIAEAQQIGSYHLQTLLGKGGMGEVWKATHRMLARPAAIKLLRPEILGVGDGITPEVALHRFEREAQATAMMQSPHTIQLYDFGMSDDGRFYCVMELLDGLDLQSLVKRFGPVPCERAVHLLRQVCASLAEAHRSGLIHRDIKPANVYVCCYGLDVDFVKVLDFGLVTYQRASTDASVRVTAEHTTQGTPAFMSPEQVLGDRPVQAVSDIYAVGCLAYWLLTGETVFSAKTATEMMIHHATTQPDPPSRRTDRTIPQELEDAILSCLEKDPSRRPASADGLSERLAAVPVVEAWSPERARRWWETHRPEAIRPAAV